MSQIFKQISVDPWSQAYFVQHREFVLHNLSTGRLKLDDSTLDVSASVWDTKVMPAFQHTTEKDHNNLTEDKGAIG